MTSPPPKPKRRRWRWLAPLVLGSAMLGTVAAWDWTIQEAGRRRAVNAAILKERQEKWLDSIWRLGITWNEYSDQSGRYVSVVLASQSKIQQMLKAPPGGPPRLYISTTCFLGQADRKSLQLLFPQAVITCDDGPPLNE